jgi:hypothetical protein
VSKNTVTLNGSSLGLRALGFEPWDSSLGDCVTLG